MNDGRQARYSERVRYNRQVMARKPGGGDLGPEAGSKSGAMATGFALANKRAGAGCDLPADQTPPSTANLRMGINEIYSLAREGRPEVLDSMVVDLECR